MHEFWEELEDVIRPDFRGQIRLHCHEGVVKTYDVVEKRQPRRGHVDIQEDAPSADLREG